MKSQEYTTYVIWPLLFGGSGGGGGGWAAALTAGAIIRYTRTT